MGLGRTLIVMYEDRHLGQCQWLTAWGLAASHKAGKTPSLEVRGGSGSCKLVAGIVSRSCPSSARRMMKHIDEALCQGSRGEKDRGQAVGYYLLLVGITWCKYEDIPVQTTAHRRSWLMGSDRPCLEVQARSTRSVSHQKADP